MPQAAAPIRAAHYLFVAWNGAGAFIVLLRLAVRLLRRGHRVTILGPSVLEEHVRAAGCAFLRDTAMDPYTASDMHADEFAWLTEHLWRGPAPALAAEVVAHARSLA